MTVRDFLKLATGEILVINNEDKDIIVSINSCYADRDLFSKRLLSSDIKEIKAEDKNTLKIYIDEIYEFSSDAQS